MSDVRRTVWIVVTYAAIGLPLYLPMSAGLNKKVMGSPRPMFWGSKPNWLAHVSGPLAVLPRVCDPPRPRSSAS